MTQIVEEIVATVPGVEEMTSTSYEGNSSVKVSFGWGTDLDAAALDVQATLEDEISELPDEIVGPRISKFDVDSFPVVVLGISSTLDPVELTEVVENQIRYRFARIPGVAQVAPWGGYNREVRVELDPNRVNALGLPLNDILAAIRDANLDRPAGQIEAGRYEVTLRAPAEFTDLEQIRDTVIERRDGALVTLRQIARVRDTYENLTRLIRVNGERGLRLAIRKQAGANTVEVARRVLEEVQAVNAEFPQIRIVPVIDQGNFIQRSIANVAQSVLYGGSLLLGFGSGMGQFFQLGLQHLHTGLRGNSPLLGQFPQLLHTVVRKCDRDACHRILHQNHSDFVSANYITNRITCL